MKISLILVALILLCLVVTSLSRRGRRRRGRRRFRSDLFHMHSHYSVRGFWKMRNDVCWSFMWHMSNSKVLPCEFRNSEFIEQSTCPYPYSCTQGPLNVEIGGKPGSFKFCSIPAKIEDACMMKYPNDRDFEARLRTCPPGLKCEAGPLRKGYKWCSYDYYFCGSANSSIPGRHFYETQLIKKACLENGAPVDNACGICDGLELSLKTQTGGTSKLKFCEGTEDDNFNYLNIWGKLCFQGNEWNPTITRTPLSGSDRNVTMPSSETVTTKGVFTEPPIQNGTIPVFTEPPIQNGTIPVNREPESVKPVNGTGTAGNPNTAGRDETSLDKLFP